MTSFADKLRTQRRWLSWIAGAFLLLLIFLIYPFKSTVVPRWRLHVRDDTGVSIAGINVTEHWQHHLIESNGHEDVERTDEGGHVEFPERTVRASLVMRAVDCLINVLSQGSQAKFGAYASLVFWGSRDHETIVVIYQPGTEVQKEVTVPRSR